MNRIIELERRTSQQEQYSRRECVELVGFTDEVQDNELEDLVVKTFNKAGVTVTKKDFHAIHRLRDHKTVIAKLVNRRHSIAILRNKKSLRNLNNTQKKQLKSKSKIYVNESLCPSYRKLMGKCNSLMKGDYISSFYTVNGKLKIKYDTDNGITENATISHEYDLDYIFGSDTMKEINDKYEAKFPK